MQVMVFIFFFNHFRFLFLCMKYVSINKKEQHIKQI